MTRDAGVLRGCGLSLREDTLVLNRSHINDPGHESEELLPLSHSVGSISLLLT